MSVCLLARLPKNVCMDLDQMLRVFVVVHEVVQMALLPAQTVACATHQSKSQNAGESITRTLSTIQVLLLQLISMTSQILPLQM